MDCEKFGKYLDNFESLTDDERLAVTAHASECERCAKEFDFMMSVIGTVKSLPDIEVPADFMERLNARIDEEERKKKLASRIAHNISRNWRQYTAAAACLALVAVLTANGKLLTGRLTGTDDGVIVNDTPVTDGTDPVPEAVIAEVTEPKASDNSSLPSAVQETQPQTPAAQTAVRAPERRRANPVSEAQSSEMAVSEADTMPEAVNTDIAEPIGIAVASLDENADNMIAAYSAEPDDMMQGRSRNAIAGYTISGKPVMETADYVEHGVGRIKISPKDEKKAMEAVLKYSYEVDGDYYTTSPDNMVNIFCDLDDNGVNYANYTPEDYEDLIKFQLVIG